VVDPSRHSTELATGRARRIPVRHRKRHRNNISGPSIKVLGPSDTALDLEAAPMPRGPRSPRRRLTICGTPSESEDEAQIDEPTNEEQEGHSDDEAVDEVVDPPEAGRASGLLYLRSEIMARRVSGALPRGGEYARWYCTVDRCCKPLARERTAPTSRITSCLFQLFDEALNLPCEPSSLQGGLTHSA